MKPGMRKHARVEPDGTPRVSEICHQIKISCNLRFRAPRSACVSSPKCSSSTRLFIAIPRNSNSRCRRKVAVDQYRAGSMTANAGPRQINQASEGRMACGNRPAHVAGVVWTSNHICAPELTFRERKRTNVHR